MKELQPQMVFIEGPQGVGKSTAAEFLESLGYKLVRGIPTGERLTKNTVSQNWTESVSILDEAVRQKQPTVMDRSVWSLVVFNMRKRPECSDLVYHIGSSMFQRGIGRVSYNVITIFATPEECLRRANSDSPVSITNIDETKSEIDAYMKFLKQMKADNFEAIGVENIGISKEEFLSRVRSLVS